MRRDSRRGSRRGDDLDSRLNALNSDRSGRQRKSGSRRTTGSTGSRKASGTRTRGRRKRSNAGPAILGLVLIAVVLGVVYFIVSSAGGGSTETAAGEGNIQVEVVQGDTQSSVADKLESSGVIGSAFMFNLQSRISGEADTIKPGRYSFSQSEGHDEIMAKLTAGEAVPTFAVTVPEGLTVEETADAVAESGDISAEQFLEAASSKDYGYAFLDDNAIKNTEGFLFPKSYEFEEGTDARQVVNRLLEQYLLETETVDLQTAQEELNLTEYELLTVASLIEREAANDEERALISSVIYNRIRAGMPLQIDATIQYARGESKENLSLRDLEIDSPYNTYQNQGLPPGPICSPSLESIEAAANPEDTNFLYYVITPDGSEHFFTDNYDEFLQAKSDAGLGNT